MAHQRRNGRNVQPSDQRIGRECVAVAVRRDAFNGKLAPKRIERLDNRAFGPRLTSGVAKQFAFRPAAYEDRGQRLQAWR